MRHIISTILAIVSLSLLTSCEMFEQGFKKHQLIIDSSASCSYEAQEFTIAYSVDPKFSDQNIVVTATANAEWITSIDTSTPNEIRLTVEENMGELRSAKLEIKASKHKTAYVEIIQYNVPPTKANHTLMFYFLGTSLSRYFKTNLEDAALAIETGILGNNNRVVFFRQEGKNSGYIGELCYDLATKKCTEKRIKNITLTSTLIKPENIGEHIATMAEIAPAERYGIVLAGHGQGWITREIINNDSDISQSAFGMSYNPWIPAEGAEVTRAFGEDNVRVNITELAEGIEYSQVQLDYILFDACFMANIEAIYDLRYSANYIIASPCEIMGKGFPYHRTLPYLFTNNGLSTDYVGATESYHQYYRDEYVGSTRCGSVTLFNCAEIDNLARVTKELVKTAKTEYDTESLQTYEGQDPHHFYDFGQWGKVVGTDSTLRKQFIDQLNNTVVETFSLDRFYSAYGAYGTYPINLGVYTGVTTSAPSQAYPNGWRATNWYKEVFELEN